MGVKDSLYQQIIIEQSTTQAQKEKSEEVITELPSLFRKKEENADKKQLKQYQQDQYFK